MRHRQSIRSEEGATLVEMALVCAFVYLPMLFGIIQVSWRCTPKLYMHATRHGRATPVFAAFNPARFRQRFPTAILVPAPRQIPRARTEAPLFRIAFEV